MKKLVAVLLTATMCFSLAACGSETGGTAEATTTVQASVAESTAETTSATTRTGKTDAEEYEYEVGPAIQEILDKGKLVVGIDSGYVPFCFTDPATGESYGVNVTVARKVAEVLGVECDIVSETFSAVLSDLSVDKIDLVAAMVTVTEERSQIMDFTEPLYQDKDYILVRTEDADKYTSKEALAGAIVVANNGSVQYTHAQELENVNLIATDSTADAALQVVTGTADAMVTNDANGRLYEIGYAGKLTMVKEVQWENSDASLAVNKGDEDLCALVNQIIEKEIQPSVDQMLDEETKRGVEMLGIGQ